MENLGISRYVFDDSSSYFSPETGLLVCVTFTVLIIVYKHFLYNERERVVWCQHRRLMDCPFLYYSSPRPAPKNLDDLRHSSRPSSPRRDSDRQYDDDLQAILIQQGFFRKRRSILPQSFNPEKEGFDFRYPVYSKTDEERLFLSKAIDNSFLFKYLDPVELVRLIDAMRLRNVLAGEVIIKERDTRSEYFYVIQKGVFEASIGGQVVTQYKNEGSFGELALLYDQPRAATVVAKSSGILWELDRTTFRKIVLGPIVERRKKYDALLSRVSFMGSISIYDRTALADALSTLEFGNGDYIKREGDAPDGLYLVESGTVSITKKGKSGQEVIVCQKSVGDYFGAFEIVCEERETCYSAKAVGRVEVAFAGMDTLERILEDMKEQVLQDREDFIQQMRQALSQ